MAEKDPIAKLNADIVDRLKASDEFIKSGLTEKPEGDVKPKPSGSRVVARTTPRARKR